MVSEGTVELLTVTVTGKRGGRVFIYVYICVCLIIGRLLKLKDPFEITF